MIPIWILGLACLVFILILRNEYKRYDGLRDEYDRCRNEYDNVVFYLDQYRNKEAQEAIDKEENGSQKT